MVIEVTKKKLFIALSLLVVVISIPLTVFLSQRQQQTRSNANPTTTMSFTPADQTVSLGQKVSFDVYVNPGTNQINFVRLVVDYDSSKLQADKNSFILNPSSNLSVVQDTSVSGGVFSVVLSIGSDPTKVIQQNTKIGTLTFNTIGAQEGSSIISFDSNQVQVRSLNGQDAFNENVFLSGAPATLTIQNAEATPTPGVCISPKPVTNVKVTCPSCFDSAPTPSPEGGL